MKKSVLLVRLSGKIWILEIVKRSKIIVGIAKLRPAWAPQRIERIDGLAAPGSGTSAPKMCLAAPVRAELA
jgi:hypothetical protein